jgi:hypothetical protein
MNRGNINPTYLLRIDRLRRLRERFRRGEIHQSEFRDLLAVEGIINPCQQDIEILESVPGMRPIGEAARRVVEDLKNG